MQVLYEYWFYLPPRITTIITISLITMITIITIINVIITIMNIITRLPDQGGPAERPRRAGCGPQRGAAGAEQAQAGFKMITLNYVN